MNNILQLKGSFLQRSNPGGGGPPNLPVGREVTSQHLKKLCDELRKILREWQNDAMIKGALVSVHYFDVVAKSNRIKGLLCKGDTSSSDSIRGSKFSGYGNIKHVFTHYVKLDVVLESIMRLEICSEIVDREYSGKITWEDVHKLNSEPKRYRNKGLAKSSFLKVIVDANYVERFDIDRFKESVTEHTIVTIYRTDVSTAELMRQIGIDMIEEKSIDETTLRLLPDEFELLKQRVPYLIAMSVRDISELTLDNIEASRDIGIVQIPSPGQEPIIGVIDTLFYEEVYFKEWVSYTRMVDKNIPTTTKDCKHGTAVTSIVVDGPTINPELDDGCGRFRVRHFGVASGGRFSSFTVLKSIREIVSKNRDVKVWNLSLGSVMQINKNFISPEAAELDKIQCEYDVIFVVAGTNKPLDSPSGMRLGAPADSINSIVVNAVDFDGHPASYHRIGPVLSFFHKPDISYYGGDIKQGMKVCTPFGEESLSGTSFATPWISRKMAYLIHTMGFTREVAKAMLIDAAAGWNRKDDMSHSVGYGIVPKRIEDILQSANDEIRFIMTGSADAYETYTNRIPIPVYNGKQPFYARATLCYFPMCSRDQGVDYTSTEMDMHFGRVKEEKGKPAIKPINDNKQGDEGFNPLREGNARKQYRKWDNIKHISETIAANPRPRKVYEQGLWGLSIKTKERLQTRSGRGLQFGVVVTLKEMYGKNRIDDFIKLCMFRGWIVNQVDMENRFDIYKKAEEELTFE